MKNKYADNSNNESKGILQLLLTSQRIKPPTHIFISQFLIQLPVSLTYLQHTHIHTPKTLVSCPHAKQSNLFSNIKQHIPHLFLLSLAHFLSPSHFISHFYSLLLYVYLHNQIAWKSIIKTDKTSTIPGIIYFICSKLIWCIIAFPVRLTYFLSRFQSFVSPTL